MSEIRSIFQICLQTYISANLHNIAIQDVWLLAEKVWPPPKRFSVQLKRDEVWNQYRRSISSFDSVHIVYIFNSLGWKKYVNSWWEKFSAMRLFTEKVRPSHTGDSLFNWNGTPTKLWLDKPISPFLPSPYNILSKNKISFSTECDLLLPRGFPFNWN